MNAEIIAVGTELLLGDIVNTNAQYISKELAGLGIGVYFQTVVGDNPERMCQAYEIAFGRSDIVITVGGLGPTEDDMTKEMAAKYFNKPMDVDEQALSDIKAFFQKIQYTYTKNNEKQALIIQGGRALPNAHGTAPGMLYEQDGKTIIMMPGPPREMIPMFDNHVAPFLRTKTDQVFVSRTLRVCGVGEPVTEEMIQELIDSQTNPTIALYAKSNEVHIRVTASAHGEDEAESLILPVVEKIYGILGDNIYGEGGTELEEALGALLIEKKMTIACAESCTAGMLTARLANVPGISKVLVEGVVTYSNDSKLRRLGVKEETLEQHGAVSPQVAEEMARGAAETAGARIGVGITGVAGPDGGTEEKPVGLVYVALCVDGETHARRLNCVGNRQNIRNRTVATTLDFIRRTVMRL